jgi:glycosyltransferase involved in cell wall biosynthesis
MTTGNNPLVSVICLCYNHERFVKESILSVLEQTYPNVELILVDDNSTDNSVRVIKETLKDHPEVKFIHHNRNKGNCKSFNEGWRMARGEFFIDLAADDTLPKERIAIGVKEFSGHHDSFGVQHGDVAYMTEDGVVYSHHSKQFAPREGDIYIDLIERYFVSSASLMIRKSVLDQLGGFDETLHYEDFDFLIRSSRHFRYFYTKEVLVNKRKVRGSMSERQFRRGSRQQLTTYRVCEKIFSLNETPQEDEALRGRLWYEIRQNLSRFDFAIAATYYKLLQTVSKGSRAAYK